MTCETVKVLLAFYAAVAVGVNFCESKLSTGLYHNEALENIVIIGDCGNWFVSAGMNYKFSLTLPY